MNKISEPLNYIIWCCENDFKPSSFDIRNAKDELARLRQSNKNSMEDNNRWLSCEKELVDLKEKIKLIFSKPVAYGLINDRHDLYGLTLYYNLYTDPQKLIPLYSNKEEFLKKEWQGGQYTK